VPGNSGKARSIGAKAEHAARRKYGLKTESTEAYDLVHPGNGYKYSVKACRTENNRGGPGRFRLWQASHKEFMGHRGSYIFAVYSPESGNIWRIEKVKQSTIDELVGGRWYSSGHEHKGKQVKLSWRDVLGE